MLGALVAGAVTLILAPVVLGGLRARQVLDVPNPRSSHDRPTPRGGGLAPAAGALVALSVTDGVTGDPRMALVVAGVGFALAGAVEDLRGVPPARRFISQVAMAVACLPWLLAGIRTWPVACGIGAVFWLVGYVNGFNFMDGINGISVAQAVTAGVAWWGIGEWRDIPALAHGGLIVAAAAAAFLPFNFPRARMFLGDVGSYFLGAWLAVLAVIGLRQGLTIEAAVAPVSVYLADTGTTLLRRMLRHEAWYRPHRDHAYQRLTAHGLSHTAVTALVACVIAACSALGAVSMAASPGIRVLADAALALLLAAYLLSPRTASGSIWPRSRRQTT